LVSAEYLEKPYTTSHHFVRIVLSSLPEHKEIISCIIHDFKAPRIYSTIDTASKIKRQLYCPVQVSLPIINSIGQARIESHPNKFIAIVHRSADDMADVNYERFLSSLKEIHQDISPIPANTVVVADWVRFKCMYGCKAYGRHFCCPPFAPTPDETRKVLSEYEMAMVIKLVSPSPSATADKDLAWEAANKAKTDLQKLICDMEKKAFLSGSPKAFGMASSPCHLCKTCAAEERLDRGLSVSRSDIAFCRHRSLVRPSMEACGIDVFSTVKNAGYNPGVLTSYSQDLDVYGLVLLY
jgi:predicted metal-binding protein